jgi:hypothetical protein
MSKTPYNPHTHSGIALWLLRRTNEDGKQEEIKIPKKVRHTNELRNGKVVDVAMGSFYTGELSDGVPNGCGSVILSNGKILTTTWKEGKMVPGAEISRPLKEGEPGPSSGIISLGQNTADPKIFTSLLNSGNKNKKGRGE